MQYFERGSYFHVKKYLLRFWNLHFSHEMIKLENKDS